MINLKEFIDSNLDLNKTIYKDYIIKYEYPYCLNYIKEFINNFNDSNYIEFKEHCFIHKDSLDDLNKILDKITIVGPVIIGKNVEFRPGLFIRENVIIGNNVVLGNSTEIKNSILFDKVNVPHYNYVGDSILGYKSHLGAGTILSNFKSDGSLISIEYKNIKEKTMLRKIGSLLGDNVEIGCNSVLLPGTIIGKNTTVYPLSKVRGYIKENMIYKDENDIVNKKIKPIMYIDFDGTLYDTDRMYSDFKEEYYKNGVTKEEMEEVSSYLKSKGPYSAMMVADELEKRYHLNVDYNHVFNDSYNYDDLDFLNELGKVFDLRILSYGVKDYQELKIKNSGVYKYFNEIIITDKKKDELDINYDAYFIDNNPKDLERIHNKSDKIIRIKRGDKYSFQECSVPVLKEINSLRELRDLILEIKSEKI